MKPAHRGVFHGELGLAPEAVFEPPGNLAAVSGREVRIGPVAGGGKAVDGSSKRRSTAEGQHSHGVLAHQILLESRDAVFLNAIVEECQRIAVVE